MMAQFVMNGLIPLSFIQKTYRRKSINEYICKRRGQICTGKAEVARSVEV
jgi:hypothetical protein